MIPHHLHAHLLMIPLDLLCINASHGNARIVVVSCTWLKPGLSPAFACQLFLQTDVILKVTTTCICGSDLHMYVGFMPGMKNGDVCGHEFMGVVESVGPEVQNLKPGHMNHHPLICIS
jgi:threonine dehydrogenase-like Zn-dependent dehydrogenase